MPSGRRCTDLAVASEGCLGESDSCHNSHCTWSQCQESNLAHDLIRIDGTTGAPLGLVHATGIEPARLHRVMMALSHLAQRAIGLAYQRLCLALSASYSHVKRVSVDRNILISPQLRRDSNPQQHPFERAALPFAYATAGLIEMGWHTGIEPANPGVTDQALAIWVMPT